MSSFRALFFFFSSTSPCSSHSLLRRIHSFHTNLKSLTSLHPLLEFLSRSASWDTIRYQCDTFFQHLKLVKGLLCDCGCHYEVIAINNKFPGPIINVTTNNNVAVNVRNKLDESLLIHWSGIQQRRSSWQDGVLGTNCPIPAKWNWTYQFQVKDQIGSFFYFPSLHLQRAAGGFGGFIINNRAIIPIPFDTPHGDIVVFIGDWYTRNHTDLRKALDDGKDLGMPDGVLINGKGPYRYNNTLVPDGIDYETIEVHPGSTDQNASTDYYIVASARFVNESRWQRVTGVAILRYTNSKGKARGPLPPAPDDQFDKTYSMNQARSIRSELQLLAFSVIYSHFNFQSSGILSNQATILGIEFLYCFERWNVSASGARPNPQGSFRYGSINVTDIYVLKNKPLEKINGKRRATLSGNSFVNPSTPIRLADQYKLKGVYKLDFPTKPLTGSPRTETSDGFGDWSENSRGTYNKWDGIARTTAQVYPGAWTAILVSLDNVGVWNLRTENLDSWYLGQETYVRVVNPEVNNKTELPIPDNALFCGALSKLQKPQKVSSDAPSISRNKLKLFFTWLIVFAWIHIFHLSCKVKDAWTQLKMLDASLDV
ncbi:hypothetical protein JHK84_047363 [Glycine max]|nr:hypothetical protein JHK84_047363 [Glycine max]